MSWAACLKSGGNTQSLNLIFEAIFENQLSFDWDGLHMHILVMEPSRII